MSRAFVREADGANDFEDLPDKLISAHRNLVTATGHAQLEAEVDRLHSEHAAAQAENDRGRMARAARDLRYWTERRRTAEVMPQQSDNGIVQFGSQVSIERDDGRIQTFCIVGEDEADPKSGTLAYVAPLAQALLGRIVGDELSFGGGTVKVLHIGAANPASGVVADRI